MDKNLSWFFDLVLYLNAIPILIGIYHYKYLQKPQKWFLAFTSVLFLTYIFSVVLSHFHIATHGIYYLVFLLGAVNYFGFFYWVIKNHKFRNTIVFLCVTMVIAVGTDFFMNGVRDFFVLPFIWLDVFLIPVFVFVLIKVNLTKSMRVLCFGILIYLAIDLLTSVFNYYLYSFFQQKVFQIVFFGIGPAISIFYYFMQSYSYILTKYESKPRFDRLETFK